MKYQRILFVTDSWGDSYVDGEGPTGILYDALNVPTDCRQSISGSLALEWVADVDGRLSRALNTPCEAVFVSMGGNDAFRYKSDGQLTKEEIDEFRSNMRTLTQKLLDAHKVVYVLLYANPYPGNYETAIGVMLLNTAIEHSCAEGTKFIQSSVVLTKEDMPQKGIHPGRSGYVKLGEWINKCMES